MFYTRRDFLSFYTIISVCAQMNGVSVLALAQMYDHIHILVTGDNRQSVSKFVQMYSSKYAQEFNGEYGQRGMVFEKPFGASVKIGEKSIRTCAGYIYNNHTNKKLCDKAESIRWNYLAYAHSNNPFSPAIKRESASTRLRSALTIVDLESRLCRPLNHATLQRIFRGLDKTETEQLTDYIIDTYRFIDYSALESLYRSYDDMVYSFNANTFNDYDINENTADRRGDDTVFWDMARYILSLGRFRDLKQVVGLPEDRKIGLATELKVITGGTWKQIGSYLRLNIRAASPQETDTPTSFQDYAPVCFA